MNMSKRNRLGEHKSRKGETFELWWSQWDDAKADAADYRIFSVVACHQEWGESRFTVLVTKASYPAEEHALSILKGDALNEIRAWLEETTRDGRPLSAATLNKGWCVT